MSAKVRETNWSTAATTFKSHIFQGDEMVAHTHTDSDMCLFAVSLMQMRPKLFNVIFTLFQRRMLAQELSYAPQFDSLLASQNATGKITNKQTNPLTQSSEKDVRRWNSRWKYFTISNRWWMFFCWYKRKSRSISVPIEIMFAILRMGKKRAEPTKAVRREVFFSWRKETSSKEHQSRIERITKSNRHWTSRHSTSWHTPGTSKFHWNLIRSMASHFSPFFCVLTNTKWRCCCSTNRLTVNMNPSCLLTMRRKCVSRKSHEQHADSSLWFPMGNVETNLKCIQDIIFNWFKCTFHLQWLLPNVFKQRRSICVQKKNIHRNDSLRKFTYFVIHELRCFFYVHCGKCSLFYFRPAAWRMKRRN